MKFLTTTSLYRILLILTALIPCISLLKPLYSSARFGKMIQRHAKLCSSLADLHDLSYENLMQIGQTSADNRENLRLHFAHYVFPVVADWTEEVTSEYDMQKDINALRLS